MAVSRGPNAEDAQESAQIGIEVVFGINGVKGRADQLPIATIDPHF